MQHQEFDAPEALRESIVCFWYTSNDFGPAERGFQVVPDGYVEIIFHFGSGCSMAMNGLLKPLPSPFMVGLLNQPVHFYTKDCLEIIGIRCLPWTVFDLLGLSSGKGGVHELEHPIAALHAQLALLIEMGSVSDAVDVLAKYFLQARHGIAADTILAKAGVAMRDANGTIPVSQVAAAAHATVRTLERKFKQSSGHSVKDISGVMRFEQVRNRLWMEPGASLAGLAQELGYTDQSHMSREFKRYSGTTPAAFARKAKNGRQMFDTDFVAFIQG